MRRITKAALGGLAGCALILGATQAAGGALPATTYTYAGALTDLQASDGPFDLATALLRITETTDGTTFSIQIAGIDTSAEGQEFGAHLHSGPCVEGNGGMAGPHYNTDLLAGARLKKAEISPETEMWFELVPNGAGMAVDETNVPFVPVDSDGVMSIVIHAEDTDKETGLAGPRQACIPLLVPQWIPDTI